MSSGKDLDYLGDVLQEVFVQGVSGLQPVDEYECVYLFTTVGDFGLVALEEVDV